MKTRVMVCLLIVTAFGVTTPGSLTTNPESGVKLAGFPLAFEPNAGQADSRVEFVARGPGYRLFLTREEAVMSVGEGAVRMQLVGADPNARIEGVDELPGKVNYFRGDDPSRWRTGISTYRRVRYRQVYPGIDLVYYGNPGELEYDFVVAPGADPAQIAFRFDREFELAPNGDLVFRTASGELRQKRPVLFQGDDAVEGEFVIRDDGAVGFDVGEYDCTRPLTVDPVLHYSSYVGGSGNDTFSKSVIDATGNLYMCGSTESLDFPVAGEDVVQPENAGDRDALIAKVNSSGTGLVFATYLGGSGYEGNHGIAVDSGGAVWAVGRTASIDFPGTATSPIQPVYGGGGNDGYVAKISADGSSLVHASFLGGSGADYAVGIAVDGPGAAYITGWAYSADFPITAGNAIQTVHGGSSDIFVAKMTPDGSSLVYSTYLGSAGWDGSYCIAVDSTGSAYVGGGASDGFPLVSPLHATHGGGYDAVLAKIAPDGSGLEFSSSFGGDDDDWVFSIGFTPEGDVCFSGATESTNFPTTPGAIQSVRGGGLRDAFVIKTAADGSEEIFSTLLGGSETDLGWALGVDGAGHIWVAGETASSDFPGIGAESLQPAYAGGASDAFVVEIDPSGSALLHATYFGGAQDDRGYGLAVNNAGQVNVTGRTDSPDFPVLHPFQGHGGAQDAFVLRLGPEDSDGDGLLDDWETYGYTHPNGEFVDLPAMGADPLHQDVFVEIDYMVGFKPDPTSLAAVVAAYAAAPVDNPDLTTGIALHFVLDEEIAHVSSLGSLDSGNYVWKRPEGSEVTHFDDLKAQHFPEELEWAVHYCIWADTIPGDFSGMARGIEASNFVVSLGPFIERAEGVVDPRWETGTFMHELGHNLGLKHGGGDGVEHKPNYLSVMNPSFQLAGLYYQGARGHWDYSFEALPDLNESGLNETVGLVGPEALKDYGTTWWMDGLPSFLQQQWVHAVNEPINWWRESVLGQPDVYELLLDPRDINDSEGGLIETLAGFDDWEHIVYTGGEVGGGIALPPPPQTPAEEQTLEEVQAFVLPEQVTGLKGHDPNKMYTLTWNPIKPKTEMTEYRVYRDGTQITATTNTNYKDETITPGDTHVYWLTWVNLLGQESVPGNKITVSGN